MLESLFEFLFKYRLLLFQQGDVAFRASWLGLLALVPAAVAGYLIFRTYANVRGNSRRLDRTMLTAIRLGIRLPPKSPNLNAYAERFVRSIKEECLTRVVPLGERHVRRLVYEYIEHYHRERNHQGLDNQLLQRPPPPFLALFDLQAVASAAAAADGLSPAACAALRDLYRQASDELRRTLDRLPVAIVNLELEGAVPRDGGADEPRGRRPGEAPDRHRLDGTGV